MRSLFYIQDFDKFNNFTGTSISKGKICIKTFTFYICNTRVIFKISERFFEWIVSAMKLIVIFIILSSSTVFEKKLLKTRIVYRRLEFSLSQIYFLAFWEFVRKEWHDSFPKSSVISNFPNHWNKILWCFLTVFYKDFFVTYNFSF